MTTKVINRPLDIPALIEHEGWQRKLEALAAKLGVPVLAGGAAGAWTMYGPAIEAIGDGGVDLDGHTFKVYLATSSYTPNTSTDDELSDIGNEASNYTRPTLTVTWTRSGTTVTFDGDDFSITASGGACTARYAVIYDDTHADDIPICYCLLDSTPADVSIPNGDTLEFALSGSGIVALAPA